MATKKIPVRVKRPPAGEITAARIPDRFSSYPGDGLTPDRLARIFRQADAGELHSQAELFEQMEEKDPHLFAQLQTRKNAVTGLDYEVIPASDGDRDKAVAEFIRKELKRIEDMEGILTDLLDAIGKGISVSEIIWDIRDRVHVKDIRWRHPKRFLWDHEDRFRIRTEDQPEGLLLPPDKFIIHRYKARSGHPSRAGILRVVAWMFLFKNYDVKDWVSFCEVYGMPVRLGKYNPSASDEDKKALMKALIQIGADAAGIIPETTSVQFVEAAKLSSLNLYESFARYCDEQMSKAVLGQTLTSDSGGGSYAQSKTHNEVRHDLTAGDCRALCGTLRRDLLRPLAVFNFGPDTPVPTLRFDHEEAEDLKGTMEIYRGLSDMGLEIPAEHVYRKFSIPMPEQEDRLISRPTSSAPAWLKALALKGAGPDPYQREIDGLADAALKEGAGLFRDMMAPLEELLANAQSLRELEALFRDEDAVAALAANMRSEELENLLYQTMLLANLKGREQEHA